MITFFVLLIVLFFIIMIFASNSKSSSFKEQFKEGAGELASYSGGVVSDLGNKMKESSIVNQIKKVGFDSDVLVYYQDFNKLLMIHSSISEAYRFKKSEMTEIIKESLIKNAIENEERLKTEILKNTKFHNKCKELNISKISLFSTRLGYFDSAESIREDTLIESFKVGFYRVEKNV